MLRKKMKFLVGTALVTVLFSGCATINDGIADGIAYTSHSISGIQFPMKTGKIYIESKTIEKTTSPNLLKLDLISTQAKKEIRCDILPELTDALTKHGWKITANKSEADYRIYTSVEVCEYGSSDLLVFKYDGAPQSIKEIANSKVHQVDVKTDLITSKEQSNSAHGTANAIGTGARTMQYNSNAGVAIMAVGILFGGGTQRVPPPKPKNQVSKNIIDVYETSTGKITMFNLEGDHSVYYKSNKDIYNKYYNTVDTFASGIFYK